MRIQTFICPFASIPNYLLENHHLKNVCKNPVIFTDNMILYVENLTDSTKKKFSRANNKFSKIAGYKISMQK